MLPHPSWEVARQSAIIAIVFPWLLIHGCSGFYNLSALILFLCLHVSSQPPPLFSHPAPWTAIHTSPQTSTLWLHSFTDTCPTAEGMQVGYASASWQCPHHHHVSFAQKAVLGWGHALLQPGQGCGTQPRRNWDKWRHSDNKFPYLAFFLSISLPCQLQPCLGAQKQLCLLSPCTKQFWQQKRLDSPPSESSESTSHVPKKRRSFRRAAAWVIDLGPAPSKPALGCLHSNCNLCRLNLCLSTDEFSSRWSPPSHKPQHTVVHVMRWRVTSPKSKQK